MRQYMSNLVTGWEVDKVRQIVAETLDTIVDPMVYEEALDLIAHHRMLGHQIIIISSSGTDVVEPIGQRLGADLAIGTQVGVEDGKYTGEILFYAYGPGKAEAMRILASERGYDLTECYAYSDSFTDVPMLEAVGNPVAVNPDTELRKLALASNWPIRDFAKPVAMKSRIDKKQAAAAGAGVALGAVALSIAWYARRRSLRV
jgi:HAD superfamily hydrolase (TIGR01490 family)